MQTWAIHIPINADNGADHERFRVDLLAIFGGFSSFVGTGAWYDYVTGRTFVEAIVRYEIACEAKPALVAMAKERFPEERAFYVAHTGTAEITDVR